MRNVVLAADYDGTLARDGVIDDETLAALERLRNSGRRLVLVTGRQLEDLLRLLRRVDLFDRIVAENGAVVYCPSDRQMEIIGEAPPDRFVTALRARDVRPLSVGHVIVATWQPNETIVLETIRDFGLELQVIFNKGAVMVLPAGLNKATGLERALAQLHLSPHNAVGVGDAENDHAFLSLCECAVAVANALPALKDRADWVTVAPQGQGVIDLVDRMIESDLRDLAPAVERRHGLPIGRTADGEPLTMSAHGTSLLIAGPSGAGKSTIATAILEQLIQHRYQFCLIDPEGDYAQFEDAIVLGDSRTAPTVDEVFDVLQKPSQSIVAVLLGLGIDERPLFLDRLMARIHGLRAEKGRPHWMVLDEAHHLLPASRSQAHPLLDVFDNAMFITVHPDHIAARELAAINVVIAVGAAPRTVIQTLAPAAGAAMTPSSDVTLAPGEALAWFRTRATPIRFHPAAPHRERLRHRRKYAEGTLGPDKSFYFRGPEQKLHLRSHNLGMFLQLANGVDDETWLYHLRLGDYSRWVREAIKDDALADELAVVEVDKEASAEESRAAIAEAIGRRYTHPA